MNIFYFNVNYSCNSNCVFCYSHNTVHTGNKYNEIPSEEIIVYLKSKGIQKDDRVIINGGEPFLHSNIMAILYSLLNIGCEVLIYTNGRCLKNFDFSFVTEKYRFVIPVHGYKSLHDRITRANGSFEEMMLGMKHLDLFNCKVDIKVILNPYMVMSQSNFSRTLQDIDSLPFNNAIHITKMADTIVSKKNNLPSVSKESASTYTKQLFEHFKNKNYKIKIFDTCINEIDISTYESKDIPIKVYFKDLNNQFPFNFYVPESECRINCPKSIYCQSAVGTYTVLEYHKGTFYKGIE